MSDEIEIDGNEPRYERTSGLECNEVPDGYVIYDHGAERVHFLNLTAAAVLELCDGQTGLATIAEVLGDSFDLAAPPRSEVQACLASLLSQGLIQPCRPSSSVA